MKPCFNKLSLPFDNRLDKSTVSSKFRDEAVLYFREIGRGERQSGDPADVEMKRCTLSDCRSLGCIDQDVLARSSVAFVSNASGRVDHDSESRVLDTSGAQAKYDVR